MRTYPRTGQQALRGAEVPVGLKKNTFPGMPYTDLHSVFQKAFVNVPGSAQTTQWWVLVPLIACWVTYLSGLKTTVRVRSLLSLDSTQMTVRIELSFAPTTENMYDALANLLLGYFQAGLYFDAADPGHSATLKSLFAVWTLQTNVAFPFKDLYPFLHLALTGELVSGCNIISAIQSYITALRTELNYLKNKIEVKWPGAKVPTTHDLTTMLRVMASFGPEETVRNLAFPPSVTCPVPLSIDPGKWVQQWVHVCLGVPLRNLDLPTELITEPCPGEFLCSHFGSNVAGMIMSYLREPKPQTQLPMVVLAPSKNAPNQAVHNYTVRVPMAATGAVVVHVSGRPEGTDWTAHFVRLVNGSLSMLKMSPTNIDIDRYSIPKTTTGLAVLGTNVPFGPFASVHVMGTLGGALQLPSGVNPGHTLVILNPLGCTPSRDVILGWFKGNRVQRIYVVVTKDPSECLPTEAEWLQLSFWGKLTVSDLLLKVVPPPPRPKKKNFTVTPTSSTSALKCEPWFLFYREYSLDFGYVDNGRSKRPRPE